MSILAPASAAPEPRPVRLEHLRLEGMLLVNAGHAALAHVDIRGAVVVYPETRLELHDALVQGSPAWGISTHEASEVELRRVAVLESAFSNLDIQGVISVEDSILAGATSADHGTRPLPNRRWSRSRPATTPGMFAAAGPESTRRPSRKIAGLSSVA